MAIKNLLSQSIFQAKKLKEASAQIVKDNLLSELTKDLKKRIRQEEQEIPEEDDEITEEEQILNDQENPITEDQDILPDNNQENSRIMKNQNWMILFRNQKIRKKKFLRFPIRILYLKKIRNRWTMKN